MCTCQPQMISHGQANPNAEHCPRRKLSPGRRFSPECASAHRILFHPSPFCKHTLDSAMFFHQSGFKKMNICCNTRPGEGLRRRAKVLGILKALKVRFSSNRDVKMGFVLGIGRTRSVKPEPRPQSHTQAPVSLVICFTFRPPRDSKHVEKPTTATSASVKFVVKFQNC